MYIIFGSGNTTLDWVSFFRRFFMKKLLNECILCLALFTIILPTIRVNAEVISTSSKSFMSPRNNVTEGDDSQSTTNPDGSVEVLCKGNNSLYITKCDIDLMAKLVYAESRGEPFNGKVAVASVVLNRVQSSDFPNSINGVIFEPRAFSCVKNNSINANPDQNCYDAVYEAIKGKDPTNEALFFYNPKISTCSWMKAIQKIDSLAIGQHVFFKN